MTIDRRTPISICQLFGHSCEPFLIFSASVLYPVWDDTEHTKTTNHIQTSTNKLFNFIFFFNTTQAWKQLLKVKYLCLLQWTPAIMFFWNWSGSSPILYRYETRKTSDRLQVYGISFINLFACGQRGGKCDSNLRFTAKFVCMSTIIPARYARGCGENTRGKQNKIK